MSAPSQSIPPRIKAPVSSLGVFAGAMLGLAAAGVAAVVFFFNPSTHGFYPVCTFHQVTGLNCPGCGGTRALYALLHGHWQLALKDNALFMILLPAAALRGAWLGLKRMRGRPAGPFLPAKGWWMVAAVAVVFTVVRNLPGFSWLSP